MASLYFPPPFSGTSLSTSSLCPFLITSPKSKTTKVAKPSQYYVSRVSCKAIKEGDNTQEPINLGMFDRRNMLIGLGAGLYGTAATLNKDPLSLAAPISPPDLATCGPADLPSGADPINCCPPFSSQIIDFKFPLNTKVRVRPAAHLVDETYIQNYKEAIRRMKALPSDDPRNFYQQANVHCAYCDGAYHQVGFPDLDLQVHDSWLFFPFHRWYLYFYERILASLVKDLDPNFSIPFWNWDTPDGMPIPSFFADSNSPLYDSLRNPTHQPPTLVDLDFDGNENNDTPGDQASANLKIMYRQVVSSSKTPSLFFGATYRAGDQSDPGGGTVENIPHGPVHTWTGGTSGAGEDMGTLYSAARDPIFYSHHGNVDRLWSIWKSLGGKRKDITDSDWLESGFLFYDENKNLVRVKVKDSLDTTKLGYVYQNVNVPWLDAKPTPRSGRFVSAIKNKLGVGAAQAAESSKETKFPLVLDSSVSTIVKRHKKSRSKKQKEEEEEVLVIEGIEFERDLGVKFDVYINDEDDVPSGPTKTEFAGSFVNLPHKHKHRQSKMKTHLRLGISELLEDLGAEDDEHVVVTLVPKLGQGQVTIGGIKIEFHK
ncbi:hypothetical protein TanjilG_13076 [Lupinus angustifolius]|uniref:Tyrosinase copper-binding domain-containing protein n=1 Tax=Lupinus angustifolius TaxID=3871 RepID=A0A1J7H1D4_LUPAN|nr:PREDICTED: polyphenol oxidase, chloroplastic-like [Lupinus angustifolius]OIV96144.1 hypothetical protein TanjilG_13076 [Lupinus angustifolius]